MMRCLDRIMPSRAVRDDERPVAGQPAGKLAELPLPEPVA
jgi:hypothetical protein